MIELWLPVAGFETSYEVSNYGYVRSKHRVVLRSDGAKQTIREKILTPKLHWGYPFVTLHAPQKRKDTYVHRLVADLFVANPQNFQEVNHIYFDRKNARSDNLEWCTHAQNMEYSKKAGRITGRPKGFESPKRIFLDEQVLIVKKMKNSGYSARKIADKFGVSASTIDRIINGTNYRAQIARPSADQREGADEGLSDAS